MRSLSSSSGIPISVLLSLTEFLHIAKAMELALMSFMQFVKNNGNRPKVIQQIDIKLKNAVVRMDPSTYLGNLNSG